MIACLYGRALLPFVEAAVRDLCRAAAARGVSILPLAVEEALADRQKCREVSKLYILPFDAPPGDKPAPLVRDLFPNAICVNSFASQDLCWDKIATQERLVDRGVPVPDTLITSDPSEVEDFVRRHDFAILKQRFSCSGQGHVVLWVDDGRLVGDSGSHQYRMMLVNQGRREIIEDRLYYPGPFYVQRLVAAVRERLMDAGQVLRAYVVDNEVRFWTERYRERYERPSDWIINVELGAKYRFVLSVSEETKKMALRAAEAVGARIAAVDMIRAGSAGPYVLEVDSDGHHMLIDRQFKDIPDYRDFFDLDRYIADALLREVGTAEVRTLRTERRQTGGRKAIKVEKSKSRRVEKS
ncbi:MAG: hypothetical protein HY270_07635 [Deltaproteobacteria bacterium]|nr:hypothetical protein [Deltaproteobacteria bacterium]